MNANLLKQNIIVIKNIYSWLPAWLDEQEEIPYLRLLLVASLLILGYDATALSNNVLF